MRAQLHKAESDVVTKNAKIFLLSITSQRWRRRAEAAEILASSCQIDHIDFVGLNSANRRWRARVDDLERENADLRIKYNLERRNNGLHPLLDDLPSNLAERNSDLWQENNILRKDLDNAREELTSGQSFSKVAREKREAQISTLELKGTRQEESMERLNTGKEELGKLTRLSDADAREALRDRIFDLKRQLQVVAAQQDALRSRYEAGAVIATAMGETGRDDEGPPGNPYCVRCIYLQDSKLEVEQRLGASNAQLEAFQKTCEDSVATMHAVLDLLEVAGQEIERLARCEVPRGGWSDGDAAKELTHIYDRLKYAMINIKKAEPGQMVNLDTMLELIDLIPELFGFQEHKTAGFAADKEELLAAQQQTKMIENTIKDYNDAAREARDVQDPGTATDPNYDITDFIRHATTAAKESDPTSTGNFTEQMDRSLNSRRGGRGIHGVNEATSRNWPPRRDSHRSPLPRPDGSLDTRRPSRPYTKGFGATRDTSPPSNSTVRPLAPNATPSANDTYPVPPPGRPNVATGEGYFENAINLVSESSRRCAGRSPSNFPPSSFPATVESSAGSDTGSPSAPIDDCGPILDENPEYWRSGHRECELLWSEIQGLQEGLRAHGVDVTRYKWLGKTIEYIDSVQVDGIERRRNSTSSLVEIQGDALQWQRNALECEVWEKNSSLLGSWDDSPYNPESKPPGRQEGNIYMGELTDWERTNVQQSWLKFLALRTELQRSYIDCGDLALINVADIITLSRDFIGRKMTTADILSKQLDFVTTQLVELQEIWERNVSTLGPGSALPFYNGKSSSNALSGNHTPQHDWRKDPQCIKLWDWVMGIQRRFRERQIRGWKELKTWQVDSSEVRPGESILESQTRFLSKHIQRLQNVWFMNEDVLGKTFTFRNRNLGWQLDWANS
ncbi:hypothetical protein BKA64DRAFT_661251 [Cadophora sp. MPI-SDFR-AT-0126]|nr:hypothetical protein BKA64DRAFT_661251 [Leotiomycetes sp. MPI-SDFR-AT-0126]